MSRDLVVMFPSYAGGKFISNCLCLSRQFVPADKNFDLGLVDNYDYRLEFVSKTLPPKTDMNHWLKFEFGEHNQKSEFYRHAKKLGLRCTRTSHGFDLGLLNSWDPCDILKLTNYEKFRSLAYQLKRTNRDYVDEDAEYRYNELKGESWPTYEEFSAVGFDTRKIRSDDGVKADINKFYPLGTIDNKTYLYNQNTIFDKTEFLNEMKKLYLELGLEDFDEEITCIFYTRYATLHNI
jgi:hypothetical protein